MYIINTLNKGSPSTCYPEEAFKMVLDIKPQIAVPMHGRSKEHKEFKKLSNEKIPDTKNYVKVTFFPLKYLFIKNPKIAFIANIKNMFRYKHESSIGIKALNPINGSVIC